MALHSSLDLLSLCTGGGGLDLGIELAIPCARTVCMVEREAFAVAHLVAAMEQGLLHPAAVWSDARTFDGRAWRGAIDGVIGGIPCQPHSLAGRKQGSFDSRDLWSEARRIVVQSRPWLVLIENVAGMLAAGADQIAGAERVWRDLRKLGFTVEIGLFTAAEIGASHERERLFILGITDVGCDKQSSGRGNSPEMRRFELADPVRAGLQGSEWVGAPEEWFGSRTPRSTSELRPAPLVHPECTERRSDLGGEHLPDRYDTGGSQASGGIGDPGSLMGNAEGFGRREGWRPIEISHLGRREHGDPFGADERLFPPSPGDFAGWECVLKRAPELEPAFRRMADGVATRMDVGRVDRLRMLGNGVVPLAAAYAIRTLGHRLAERGSACAARLVRLMTPE